MDHDLFAHDPPPSAPAEGTSGIGDVPARRGPRAGAVVAAVAGAVAMLAAWGVVAMAVNADRASDLPSGVSDTSSSYSPDSPSSYSPDNSGSSGSSTGLPLGPIGEASCRSAVSEAKSYVPGAIRDAQNSVDDLIAENPELAAYASDAKRMLAESAPQVNQSLDDAGRQLGC
jgi:hypothetical protein